MKAEKQILVLVLFCGLLILSAGCATSEVIGEKQYEWGVHDQSRPLPKVVAPGQNPGDAPADALVLFDGTDISQWSNGKGEPAQWKVENGYMEVNKTGGIQTKKSFGSCQLHVEWATPDVAKGTDQGRGNSGVFLMGHYEVQVLDCYENKTYADGHAGAIYAQKPPMVNVCRGPGIWQSYDIIFHAPRFEDGRVVRPATVTVLQNGVLIQDHWVIEGTTAWKQRASYKEHAAKLPLTLQDHGNPVRYRNIWIRELTDTE